MHLMVLNLRVIYAILTVASSAKFAHIAQDGAPSTYVGEGMTTRPSLGTKETGGDGTAIQGSTGQQWLCSGYTGGG